MDPRLEILNLFYGQDVENTRLERSRHGQLEYLTTMRYIHRYLNAPSTILEVGAGTGRYSVALAKEGHDVTAIELVKQNYDRLLENGAGISSLQAKQGDALDLSALADDTFDLTLMLGPMYHLYSLQEQHRALDEAIRVTKPGGMLLVAFLSVHAILYANYLQGNLLAGLEENFTADYQVRHFPEQLFTGFDPAEFEALFKEKPVRHITTVSADSILEVAAGRDDFSMSDEDFAAFASYHFATCEKRELLGAANHLLYMCQKQK